MSERRLAILLATLCLASALCAAPRAATAQPAGSVTAVEPPAEIGRDGAWGEATVGSEVRTGDTLRTGPAGRLKVVLADGSVLVVSERSVLVIDEHVYRPADGSLSSVLELLSGKVRAVVNDYYGASNAKFEIKTDTAVAGVRGTDFVVRYDERAAATEVIGVSGRVSVHNPGLAGRAVLVTARTQTLVERGRAPTEPRAIDDERFRYYLDDVEFIGGAQSGSLGFSQPLVSGKEVPAPEQAGAAANAAGAGGIDLDKIEDGPGMPDAAGLGDQPPAALEAGDVGVRF
jgi:opacity protein-like surface antigen